MEVKNSEDAQALAVDRHWEEEVAVALDIRPRGSFLEAFGDGVDDGVEAVGLGLRLGGEVGTGDDGAVDSVRRGGGVRGSD